MSDSTEPEDPPLAPWVEKLISAVQAIDQAGTFCCGGRVDCAPSPGLEVDRIGAIGLPLSAERAERLKGVCQVAAYGKGTLTVIDTEVRRVWRLTPDRFKLTNPKWPERVRDIVAAAQRELGLEGQKLEPHLYDLLLYEKGGFFRPHRDGEKLDRMVATLVITLPSAYAGGELVVRHDGETQTFDFADDKPRLNTHFAAFYADCEHEIKPLADGYRICLIYNLTLAKASGQRIAAPSQRPRVDAVAAILQEGQASGAAEEEARSEEGADDFWRFHGVNPALKLAHTLQYKYSEQGLAWDALKGIDRGRGRILAQAARQAGWHVHLALLTLWESGFAGDEFGFTEEEEYEEGGEEGGEDEDEDAWPVGGGGRRRVEKIPEKSADEGDGSGEGEGEHDIYEISDSVLSADHWRSPDGDSPPFGPVALSEDEVVPVDSLRKMKPREEYQGYTGNEGMNLDRWYRRAAIVLWPESSHFTMLRAGGPKQAAGMLEHMAAAAERASGDAAIAARKECHRLAKTILKQWTERWDWRSKDHKLPDPSVAAIPEKPEAKLLKALDFLDDQTMVHEFIRTIVLKDPTVEPGDSLVKILGRGNWAAFRDDLGAIFKRTTKETMDRNVGLLNRLCQAADKSAAGGSAGAVGICRALAKRLLTDLAAIDSRRKAETRARDDRKAGRLLAAVAIALLAIDADDLLSGFVDHMAAQSRWHSFRRAQWPALAETDKWLKAHPAHAGSAAFSRWVEKCREHFESLAAAEPQPPADFAREATVKCRCGDCAELNRFLANPTEPEHDFGIAKSRREHLQYQIKKFKCDIDCATIGRGGEQAKGSPRILRCVKNIASHPARVAEFQENKAHLEALRAMA